MSKTRKEKDSLGTLLFSHGQVGSWMSKTYKIVSPLSPQAASGRIAALFSEEGVAYDADDFVVNSTRTPIAILGTQRVMYTHNNWVGLNPFAYVSSVNVRFEACEGGLTKVILQINRVRAFLFLAIFVDCAGMGAVAISGLAGAIVFDGLTIAAWLGIVSLLGGYLIKRKLRIN